LAREFANQVGSILTGLRLSNDARFRLTWEPRKELGANGVNYSSLTQFVMRDVEAASPAARDAMILTFRQRLEAVRADASGKSKDAYSERLAQEFDYRSWYEFRLFFQPAHEPEFELKGRGIGRLSGGERTLAQVLPLVAALHARSLGARHDAPKLMCLDEAFVGTDAVNVEEILRILVELDFSWLFIGDKVWGDSARVNASATYTLLADGGVIAPVLYVWDGTRRRRLSEAQLKHPAAPVAVLSAEASAHLAPTLFGHEKTANGALPGLSGDTSRV
jgi:hypothetical protein